MNNLAVLYGSQEGAFLPADFCCEVSSGRLDEEQVLTQTHPNRQAEECNAGHDEPSAGAVAGRAANEGTPAAADPRTIRVGDDHQNNGARWCWAPPCSTFINRGCGSSSTFCPSPRHGSPQAPTLQHWAELLSGEMHTVAMALVRRTCAHTCTNQGALPWCKAELVTQQLLQTKIAQLNSRTPCIGTHPAMAHACSPHFFNKVLFEQHSASRALLFGPRCTPVGCSSTLPPRRIYPARLFLADNRVNPEAKLWGETCSWGGIIL